MRTHLLTLAALLLSLSAFAQTGRRYTPRDTFARFSSDKCFDLTREEGERAFRARDWETAAALFRAAKNCTDADQKKRTEMSQRIGDSRKAAIAELVEKEREATRTARHALATNRANDALLLLKDSHRSLAFRLADFADRYIAPDGQPNANCRQAMLDAWDYLPYYHSWMRSTPNLRVPFCFQLAENLHPSTQLCYQQRNAARLYAFSPEEHLLRWWSNDLTYAAEPIRMDTSLTGFEASPDGQTLLFYSNKRWVLWRSANNFFPIETAGARFHAFSPSGQTFYYLERSQIRAVPMSRAFTSRANRSYQRKTLDLTGYDNWPQVDTTGLLGFAVKDSFVYLAYPDRVLVVNSDTSFACPMPYTLPADVQPEQVKFWLKDRLLTYTSGTYDHHLFARFKLPASVGGPVVQEAAYGEKLLAFNPQMLATQEPSEGRIFFRENADTTISHFVRYPGDWVNGAMSLEGNRCAVLLADRTLRVFELEKTPEGAAAPYFKTAAGHHFQFTPDGEYFAVRGIRSMEVFSTDNLENAVAQRPIKASGSELAIGNNWVVYRCTEDSIELLDFQRDSSWRLPLEGNSAIALSDDERFFAFSQGTEVWVIDLNNSAEWRHLDVKSKPTRLLFVPNSTKLMFSLEGASSFDLDIKFWDTAHPDREPEVLLLSEFSVPPDIATPITLSPDGRRVALNSSTGIHIFDLSNLTEEYNLIRAPKLGEATVTTIAFSPPDGRLLAMGYSDGHTIAWDIATRRQVYRLAPPNPQSMPVAQIHFSEDGLLMRQVLLPAVMRNRERIGDRDDTEEDRMRVRNDSTYWETTNTFSTRLLDFNEMRLNLSNDARQLVAFSPDQILDYDLESALSYPGNFEQLAQSGDLPLIRSFFGFYEQQAQQSNNSAQVRQYCDRAFQLYQNLENHGLDMANRESLRDRMLGMYNDLIWKLIQRSKLDEANSAVKHVSRNFGHQLDLVRWNGHTALLRGESHLKTAINCYVDWLILNSEEAGATNKSFYGVYDILGRELAKLNTYGLLQDKQKQALYALFGESMSAIDDWAPTLPTSEKAGSQSAPPASEVLGSALDPITRQRWRIFQGLSQIDLVTGFSEKTRLLEGYLEDAKKLVRQSPAYRSMLEWAALELARTHIAHGDFEQGNNRSLRLYVQATYTLQSIAPFKAYVTEYWDALSNAQLLSGNIQLAQGNMAKAAQAYEESRKALRSLQSAAQNTPDRWVWDETYRDRLGPLLTQLGMTRLYENLPNDADTLFEEANRTLPSGLSGLYFGHAAILRGDRDGALIRYGDIQDASQLGQALAEIERMAERVPDRRAVLQAFSSDLRRTAAAVKTDIDSVAAQHSYADFQVQHFAATQQWAKTQAWSREVLRCVQKLRSAPAEDAEIWEERWFEAHLNAAYYHLFGGSRDTTALSAAIRYSRAAEKHLAEDGGYYTNAPYLKTNLAHALLLRNGPGDREAALREYQAFLASDSYGSNYWELLQKDFRDLEDAGVQWPADMPQVMQQISAEVKRQMQIEEK